uniref:Uncharacterized protein n=1 Tax=Magallana gigas TaxID=29159 RepID=K1QR31_MAGGI
MGGPVALRSSSFGANLQLHRLNASVFWQGKGGMRWKQVCPKDEAATIRVYPIRHGCLIRGDKC